MIKYTDTYGNVYYTPDPKIANNTLVDSFYLLAGFDTMSLDDAMKLIKAIFDSLPRNCSNELCECVRMRQSATNVEDYSMFFESDENAAGMSQLISSLDEKLRVDRNSFEEYAAELNLDQKNYPALSRFAYNNEFTNSRASQYNKYYTCTGQKYTNVMLKTYFFMFLYNNYM